MLDSVLSYVKQVNDGSLQGDAKIGRHLFETLASVPVPTSFKGTFDEDFNTHLAVSLQWSPLFSLTSEFVCKITIIGSPHGFLSRKCRTRQFRSSSKGVDVT